MGSWEGPSTSSRLPCAETKYQVPLIIEIMPLFIRTPYLLYSCLVPVDTCVFDPCNGCWFNTVLYSCCFFGMPFLFRLACPNPNFVFKAKSKTHLDAVSHGCNRPTSSVSTQTACCSICFYTLFIVSDLLPPRW